MLLRVVAQSLKPVKRLATCKRTQQLLTLFVGPSQQCWELLRPFACSFRVLILKITAIQFLQSRIKGLEGVKQKKRIFGLLAGSFIVVPLIGVRYSEILVPKAEEGLARLP